jgi:trehalose 6-phosphate phosphatase
LRFNSEAQLTNWALQAQHLWLFLDYDGTLVDLCPTPDLLEPNYRVIDLLERLAHQSTMRLTIITGRKLPAIKALLPVSGIFLAGTYGIELFTPSGQSIQRVDYTDIRPFLERIKPHWEQIIAERKGFFLEDKGWTLAMHALNADSSEAEVVFAKARQAINKKFLSDRFHILDDDKLLEIVPAQANKRETVFYLIQQYPLQGMQLLYIGNDDKDEDAFSAVHTYAGVAIKVIQPSQSSHSTEADYIMESPQDVNHWLKKLVP